MISKELMELMPVSKNLFNKLLMLLILIKKEKAELNLESAKDHCDRVENDYEISLEAIER